MGEFTANAGRVSAYVDGTLTGGASTITLSMPVENAVGPSLLKLKTPTVNTDIVYVIQSETAAAGTALPMNPDDALDLSHSVGSKTIPALAASGTQHLQITAIYA
jgi:hypothetical protein